MLGLGVVRRGFSCGPLQGVRQPPLRARPTPPWGRRVYGAFTGFWSRVPEPWTVLKRIRPNLKGLAPVGAALPPGAHRKGSKHSIPHVKERVLPTSLNPDGSKTSTPYFALPLLREARGHHLSPNPIPLRIFLFNPSRKAYMSLPILREARGVDLTPNRIPARIFSPPYSIAGESPFTRQLCVQYGLETVFSLGTREGDDATRVRIAKP